MKRRQFLGSTVASAGVAAGLFSSSPLKANAAPFSTDPFAKIQLTPQVSATRIGLGTGVHGGNRNCNLTRMDRSRAIDIIRYCYDVGIRFFDMADMYGSHGLVTEALAGKPRDSYVLSTKIWCHRGGGLPEKERPTADILLPRFLKELNTDYIDIVQLHCLTNTNWADTMGYQFEPLDKLKEKGVIRAHGVSCHSNDAADMAAGMPWVDAIHTRLNNAGQRMVGSWDENVRILNKAKANGKGTIIMKVLGEGTIRTAEGRKSSTDAITRLPSADVMIVGFEQRSHVDEFVANVSETLKNMAQERAK